jgi:hypothetical protein
MSIRYGTPIQMDAIPKFAEFLHWTQAPVSMLDRSKRPLVLNMNNQCEEQSDHGYGYVVVNYGLSLDRSSL